MYSYYGGNTNLMDKRSGEGFGGWQPTVRNAPWLYRGKIERITELIKDEKTKRELNKAITAHLDKAYMKVDKSLKIFPLRYYQTGESDMRGE